jgi:hypothetical protein
MQVKETCEIFGSHGGGEDDDALLLSCDTHVDLHTDRMFWRNIISPSSGMK